MDFLGIDPSMTGTGTVLNRSGLLSVQVLAAPAGLPLGEQIQRLAAQTYYDGLKCEELWVAIEEPLLKGNGALARGALYGAILSHLSWAVAESVQNRAINPVKRVLSVNPTHLKIFACGARGAAKDEIRVEVLKRWGFEHSSNDAVDAYVLSMLAECCYTLHYRTEVERPQLAPGFAREAAKFDGAWTEFQLDVAEKVLAGRGKDGRKKRTRVTA